MPVFFFFRLGGRSGNRFGCYENGPLMILECDRFEMRKWHKITPSIEIQREKESQNANGCNSIYIYVYATKKIVHVRACDNLDLAKRAASTQ